ncbi:hypothetical protein Tco_1320247 [Tanacetum coccineum]
MGEQKGVLDSMARDYSRFTTWTVTSLSRMMDQSGVRYMSYSDSQDVIRRILGFRIRRIDYLYGPCCKEINELVMVYSEKDVC